ncbi:MAG: MATE family efflux transporter [Clostridia bacterium]|nr:MATE family efflux transporter [Clostridia bacterium]MBQ9120853.1 MATE family efflux transporter [Clostridia bacterium]
MADSRKKIIFKNVAPAILANACVFLFSVVDGIFVGQGAGMDALGAVNLALPFVLLVQALNAMASIGGVTITAIRFGRGDKEGAQNAFMHAVTINFIVGCLVTLIGCGLTAPVCKLLGATGNYLELAKDYVFWWALFAIANSVSLNLQSFCRNDGNPGLVAVTNVVITVLNIFLDWLFVFPLGMGVAGAAIATGISQVVGLCVILTHFIFKKGELRIRKYKPQGKLYRKIVLRGLPEAIAQFSTPVTTFCMNQTLMATYGDIGINAFSIISYLSSFTMSVFFGASEGMQPLFGQAYGAKQDDDLKGYYRAGQIISVIGSAICVAIYVIFPLPLCKLFGADDVTAEFTAIHMWEYCWGFVVGSMNTMISAYLYSTKRSGQAIALNIVRSLVMNSLVITFIPMIFGKLVVWHTFGIFEVLVLVVALIIKNSSERKGIVYK